MTSQYIKQYNEALSSLKKLEIDKALSIFYRLLVNNPSDYLLIRQIYKLEIAKPVTTGLEKIALYIFSQADKSQDFHTIIIECYGELKKRLGFEYFKTLSYQQILNLFYHLGQTTLQEDLDILLVRLKSDNPNHPALAPTLFIYCEQLISKRKYLKAKLELEYLMVYYTEAETQIAAEKLFKRVAEGIRQ